MKGNHGLLALGLSLLTPSLHAAERLPLLLDGEVAALRSAVLGPPSVRNQWQFQIISLATDGSRVEAGDVVVEFDAGDLNRRLNEARSKANEARSEREKVLLELAERERNERLALAEERAQLEKARRKAAQPVETLPSIEYQKLIVSREQAESRMTLIARRAERASQQRKAELALVESTLAQAQGEVDALVAAIAQMRVTAPRAGILQVLSDWNGARYEVGAQVWVGRSVASIPDPSTLVVRAVAPERELSRLRDGHIVRVSRDGAAVSTMPGRVSGVGRAVHSKSALQPIPVLDVLVQFDVQPVGLKPGQTVRVEFVP